MSASTETLVKLRGLTAEGRGKANVAVPTSAVRRYKTQHSYNLRVNKVDVLQGVQLGGNYSFKVPAFKQVIGEMWMEISLPELAGNHTWKTYPLCNVVERVTYRAGQKFYEFEPAKDFPILLNSIRDPKMKEQLLAMLKDHSGAASKNAGTYILPMVTPFSIWNTDRLAQPLRHGNRGGAFMDCSRLADNLVVELQFASRAVATSDAASSYATAANLGNVTLRWEEIVAAPQTLAQIRREIPKSVCCDEYTRLERQDISSAQSTVYKCASLVSRAGTRGFYFKVDAGTDDIMTGAEHVASLKVRCDGRDIYDTDSRPDDTRSYQRILAGDPGDVGQPKWAHFFFGNQHDQFDANFHGSLLKNGACNELDLEIQAESGGSKIDIIACHSRQFSFADGTIKVSNAY